MTIKATSDAAFRRLIGRVVSFYSESLFNPHWGEQIAFQPGNVLAIAMVFQGLDQQQAETIWRPFLDWLAGSPQDFSIERRHGSQPCRPGSFWDPGFLKELPGLVLTDDRPGAPRGQRVLGGQSGRGGTGSARLPVGVAPCLAPAADRQEIARRCPVRGEPALAGVLHLNKGLAGAPADAIAAARDTAMNPAVLDAFALIISAAEGPPAYPGIPGHEPDLSAARSHAEAIDRAMSEIRMLLPTVGSYVAESDFFEQAWQDSFWGPNYPRLLAVKDKYDPDGLFIVHHGVGSERWSADGFTRLAGR